MKKSHTVWFFAATIVACVACSRPSNVVEYGDPFGMRTSDEAGKTYEFAIVTNRGRDTGPLVTPLAGALFRAAKKCLQAAEPNATTRVHFQVQKGNALAKAAADDPANARCMLGEIQGATILAGEPDTLDFVAEIRALTEAAKPVEAPK